MEEEDKRRMVSWMRRKDRRARWAKMTSENDERSDSPLAGTNLFERADNALCSKGSVGVATVLWL